MPQSFSSILKSFVLTVCIAFVVSGCARERKEELLFGYSILEPKGNTILALYDGSEKRTGQDNEIRKFLDKNLKNLGLEVRYHDINRGVPDEKLTKDIRGIITWFIDSKMMEADAYCRWLTGQIDGGRKIVILDNFGAYQDSESEEWTDMNVINSVFTKLGVTYRANWTSDSELLEIVYKDADVVEKESKIDLSEAKHYYLFRKSDDRIKSFLTIRRKDLDSSESCIIFSHANGGMALSRYIMTIDKDTGTYIPNIDLYRFLKESLFWKGKALAQKILIVWDKRDEKEYGGRDYIKNLIKTLEYAKIDFEIVKLKSLSRFLTPDYENYSSVVFCTEYIWEIEDEGSINAIKEYIKNGGGLFVILRSRNEMLDDVYGVSRYNGFFEGEEGTRGLKITKSFFPGSELVYYPKRDMSNNSIDYELNNGVEVLARALDKTKENPDGTPIIWLNLYGKGRVVFWNSDTMRSRFLRGLLLQSMLLTQPVSVFSLANVESIHMDDCPQPMYNMLKEPIKTDFNMTDTDFYLNVWWNDILDLAKKHNIHFTFYTILNYDAKLKAPFEGRGFYYGKDNASLELTKRIIDNNFELGLHGYNHQSLVLKSDDEEKGNWETEDDMKHALERGRDLWWELFPETEAPFSYVAPMNIIGPTGKEILHETFPTIKVISPLLFGGDVVGYEQEFGEDPDVPYFYNIPRFTAGYNFNQVTKNVLVDVVNTFGVWTHFLHPDDVYGKYAAGTDAIVSYEEEPEKGWGEMYASADAMFKFVRETYPWLRNMSTKDTYYELVKYFNDKRSVKIEDDAVKIAFSSGSGDKKYFVLRINDGRNIGEIENCELIHSYPDLNMHVFETGNSNIKIGLKNE